MKTYLFSIVLSLLLLGGIGCKDTQEQPDPGPMVTAQLVIDGDTLLNINASFCDYIDKTVLQYAHSSQSHEFKYTVGQKFENIRDNYLHLHFIDTAPEPVPVTIELMQEMIDRRQEGELVVYPEISILYGDKYYKTLLINYLNGVISKYDDRSEDTLEYGIHGEGNCTDIYETLKVRYIYSGYAYSSNGLDSVFIDDSLFEIYLGGMN